MWWRFWGVCVPCVGFPGLGLVVSVCSGFGGLIVGFGVAVCCGWFWISLELRLCEVGIILVSGLLGFGCSGGCCGWMGVAGFVCFVGWVVFSNFVVYWLVLTFLVDCGWCGGLSVGWFACVWAVILDLLGGLVLRGLL